MGKNEEMFSLSFLEAMEAIFRGGAVQGEHFDWHCYLTAQDNVVKLNTFQEDGAVTYAHSNCLLTKDLLRQKYRAVVVLNRTGLFHD